MSQTTIETQQVNREAGAKRRYWRKPVYKVSESGDDYRVRVEIPGVNREGVDLTIEDEVLSVRATRASSADRNWKSLRRELPQGDFHLDLKLTVALKEDQISAKVENGILDLILPKADEVKARKIQVS